MIAAPIAALGFASGPYYGGKDDGMMMCPTEMPPPKYTGPIDYSISAYGQSCIETEINCFNRYSPFIPMAMEVVTTTVMALGSRKLAKKDAIVAKLSAIEEMAGMNMLCSDKTGE